MNISTSENVHYEDEESLQGNVASFDYSVNAALLKAKKDRSCFFPPIENFYRSWFFFFDLLKTFRHFFKQIRNIHIHVC